MGYVPAPKKLGKLNKLGVRGVTEKKSSSSTVTTTRWQSRVYFNGKSHQLGMFSTLRDAGESLFCLATTVVVVVVTIHLFHDTLSFYFFFFFFFFFFLLLSLSLSSLLSSRFHQSRCTWRRRARPWWIKISVRERKEFLYFYFFWMGDLLSAIFFLFFISLCVECSVERWTLGRVFVVVVVDVVDTIFYFFCYIIFFISQ